jgi:hypothetical protein
MGICQQSPAQLTTIHFIFTIPVRRSYPNRTDLPIVVCLCHLLFRSDPPDPYQGERDEGMGIAPPPDNPTLKEPRRRVPNAAAHRLYDSWTTLLPTLTDALITFASNSMGLSPPPQVGHITTQCTDGMHERKTSNIACLYFNRELWSFLFAMPRSRIADCALINVTGCTCETIPQVLVSHGLFPTAPSRPQMAVSIELLEFYSCLFEQSCDAINALAAALRAFYARRGFSLKKLPCK